MLPGAATLCSCALAAGLSLVAEQPHDVIASPVRTNLVKRADARAELVERLQDLQPQVFVPGEG